VSEEERVKVTEKTNRGMRQKRRESEKEHKRKRDERQEEI